MVYGPVLKALQLFAHAPIHVIYNRGSKTITIGIPDPTLPIYYTTFMGLR